MTGILNYDTTFQKWEIIFFDKNIYKCPIIFFDKNIYKCPIIEKQLSILEMKDNGQEINFLIRKYNVHYFAFLCTGTINTKHYFNYKNNNLVFVDNNKITIYNNKLEIIDTMHKDYFMNIYHSNEFIDISLKQFLWIFNTFKTYDKYNLIKNSMIDNILNTTDTTNMTYSEPRFNSHNIPHIQLKIDPYNIFTNSNISI